MDRLTALRLEKIWLVWEYHVQELDLHRQILLQVFAAALAGLIGSLLAVGAERLPALPGLGLAGLLAVAAIWAQARLWTLLRLLRQARQADLQAIDAYIAQGGE